MRLDIGDSRSRILQDARVNCEVARELCRVARELRDFCVAQRDLTLPERDRAIKERRTRYYGATTDMSSPA